MTAKENIMPSSTTYQSPFGSDAARTKLRSALLEHFHSQGPASVQGYTRWTAPSAQLPQQKEVKLLVGDPIALAVSPPPFARAPSPSSVR
jgi:hypothetical protein